jgi:hypothetical protein
MQTLSQNQITSPSSPTSSQLAANNNINNNTNSSDPSSNAAAATAATTTTTSDTFQVASSYPKSSLSSQQSLAMTSPMNLMPECQGCLCLIQDRYYLQVMEKAWHLNCLRCVDCKFSLDSQQSCFAKDGAIYCKEDYFK